MTFPVDDQKGIMVRCAICLGKLSDRSMVIWNMACGHWTFHSRCLKQWMRLSGSHKCPICQQECDRGWSGSVTASFARDIHNTVWKEFAKIRLCCSRHTLISSGFAGYCESHYGDYDKLLSDAAGREKPVEFARKTRNKKYVLRIFVKRDGNTMQMRCSKFFVKDLLSKRKIFMRRFPHYLDNRSVAVRLP